jgi:hypothetical protein
MNLIQYPVKTVADFFNLYKENNGFKNNPFYPKEYSIYTCIPLSLLFVIFRYGFQKYFQYIKFSSPEKSKKFSESLYKFCYYSLTFYGICYILNYEEQIYPNIKNCWNYVLEGQTRSLVVSGYYIFELSYYLSELFCMSWLETKRKDHVIMYIHHLTTITLLGLSYIHGFHRIGILVLFCHNINDIFLEAAKMCNYLGLEILANINFGLLLVSWILSRLYFLPFFVIHSTYYDTYELALNNLSYFPIYYIANFCLAALCVMHIYWFYLICKIAYNAIKNGSPEDNRED